MSDSVDIGYKIIREEWNVYRVENGTILKMRTPLTALKRVETGKTGILFGSMALVAPVKEDHGKPSGNEQIREKDVIGPVNFEAIKEVSNIYETDGQFLVIVVPRITNLVRTRKFDGTGARMYQMTTAALISIIPFPSPKETTGTKAPDRSKQGKKGQ